MRSSHLRIQEELALWALGISPDAPIPALAEHLAGCDECRRLVDEMYETAGQLAWGAPLRRPPGTLKERILAQVHSAKLHSLDGAGRPEAVGDDAPLLAYRPPRLEPVEGREMRKTAITRAFKTWVGGSVAALLVLFLTLSNISLNRSIGRQAEQLAAWETRYETDFRWLRSAEYLLVQEIGPARVASLVPPAALQTGDAAREGQAAPEGKAAVYDAYDHRVYLIVWVSGLQAEETYDVWAQGEGAGARIGALTTDAQGNASLAYPGDTPAAWRAIEVRGRDGKALLAGELVAAPRRYSR